MTAPTPAPLSPPSLEPSADRAAGAIVGAFIGDALGLGPHWYYDLDELRRDFGPWISGYTDPKPHAKYHAGMKGGDLSQTGIIMLHLLRSLADRGGYNESDFTRRLDEQFLRCLTAHLMSVPADTPTTPSAKSGRPESRKGNLGARPAAMQIHRKPPNESPCWPPAMP